MRLAFTALATRQNSLPDKLGRQRCFVCAKQCQSTLFSKQENLFSIQKDVSKKALRVKVNISRSMLPYKSFSKNLQIKYVLQVLKLQFRSQNIIFSTLQLSFLQKGLFGVQICGLNVPDMLKRFNKAIKGLVIPNIMIMVVCSESRYDYSLRKGRLKIQKLKLKKNQVRKNSISSEFCLELL